MILAGNHILVISKTKMLTSLGVIHKAKRFFIKKNFTQFILYLCNPLLHVLCRDLGQCKRIIFKPIN